MKMGCDVYTHAHANTSSANIILYPLLPIYFTIMYVVVLLLYVFIYIYIYIYTHTTYMCIYICLCSFIDLYVLCVWPTYAPRRCSTDPSWAWAWAWVLFMLILCMCITILILCMIILLYYYINVMEDAESPLQPLSPLRYPWLRVR